MLSSSPLQLGYATFPNCITASFLHKLKELCNVSSSLQFNGHMKLNKLYLFAYFANELEAELERIGDPEMFERPSNATSSEGKTGKPKGKIQGKYKVCCKSMIINIRICLRQINSKQL